MKLFLWGVIFLCHFSQLMSHDFPYNDADARPAWRHRLKHHATKVSKIAVAVPVVPVTTLAGVGLGVLSMPVGAVFGVLFLDFRFYGPQPKQTKTHIFHNACRGAWSGLSTYTKDGAKFGYEWADEISNKMMHFF